MQCCVLELLMRSAIIEQWWSSGCIRAQQRLHHSFRQEHFTKAAVKLYFWRPYSHSSDSWDLKSWMRSFMYLAMGV